MGNGFIRSFIVSSAGYFPSRMTAWCERHQIPYQGVPVGTIKRHATGKGNAGKAEVIAAMKALGHPVTDDNEADALALLHWALAQGTDPALSKEVRHG